MRNHVDYPLLVLTLALVGSGILIVSSASIAISEKNFGNVYAYTIRHLAYAGVGLIALYCGSRIPYKLWQRFSPLIIIAVLFLLGVVFFPIVGLEHGGAARWINVGAFSFQPSELLKLGLILYLAAWLSLRR